MPNQTKPNLAINLVQQERVHLAESAKGSMLQEPGWESEPTKIDGLSKLYKPDLPSNSSPQERLCTISPTTEPFALHAREGMRACGVKEGSMEDLELRKAASHRILTNWARRPPDSSRSIEVEVSETEADPDVFRDPDEDIDGRNQARDAEIFRPPRPSRRDMTDATWVENPAEMRRKGVSMRKRRV